MNEDTWPWLLFGCELVGLYAMSQLVGRRKLWYGWLIVAACMSLPWLGYSISSGPRYGFVALSLLWLTVHVTNAYRWRVDRGSNNVPAS
jgi:hypothetical protein